MEIISEELKKYTKRQIEEKLKTFRQPQTEISRIDKYYKPSIEEFYEGFEFVILQDYNDSEVEVEVIHFNFTFSDLERFFDPEKLLNKETVYHVSEPIYVKKLDHFDLYDLGFKYLKRKKYKEIYFRGDDKLYYYPLNNLIEIKYPFDEEESKTLFIGEVKNKSELKRILNSVL